jgi:TM2 domain-containing membrane protein YozV
MNFIMSTEPDQTPLESTPPPVNPGPATPGQIPGSEKKLVSGILAILLGSLGVHKFYLGYNTEGIIMLAIGLGGWFVCGFPTLIIGVIALVEGVIYLTKSDEEFVATYINKKKGWF